MDGGFGQEFRHEVCTVDVVSLSKCKGQEEAFDGWVDGNIYSGYGHATTFDTHMRHCGTFSVSAADF